MTGYPDLISHYQKYFYTVKATTSELKKQAFHIRYQVYYEEHKIITADQVNGSAETDIWDQSSIHGLQFHKPSNQPIGNVRLIPLETSITHTLPIEEHYINQFDFQNLPITHLRQGSIGEISRMAILSTFRRRNADKNYSYNTDQIRSNTGEKRFPINYMPMCLAFTAIILLMEEQIDYGAALMEPRLARLLARYGIDLKQIGKPMDYFGMRAPYLIFPESTYQRLSADYKALFDIIKEELSSS